LLRKKTSKLGIYTALWTRDNDDNDDESDSYDPFDCSDIVIPTVKQVADRVLKKGLNQRKDLNSRKLIRTANMTTTSDGDDESCDDLNNKPNDSNTNNGDNNDSIENSSNANNKMMSVNGNNVDDAILCTSSIVNIATMLLLGKGANIQVIIYPITLIIDVSTVHYRTTIMMMSATEWYLSMGWLAKH